MSYVSACEYKSGEFILIRNIIINKQNNDKYTTVIRSSRMKANGSSRCPHSQGSQDFDNESLGLNVPQSDVEIQRWFLDVPLGALQEIINK